MTVPGQNLKDIFQLALLLERKGFEYYSELERRASNQRVRDMFHRLAEDEKEHAHQFTRILEMQEEPGNAHHITSESTAYICALQGHSLMGKAATEEEVPNDPRLAIAMGIQAEKDSILMYHELFETLPPGLERDMVGKLLKEEKMHLVELRNYLEEM
ncbi:MAG: ferritin family protein [Syntrophomonadaceae bacterium]|nr:ferritin family protein [Syntrophomonadaceae bacterium]